jgi:hypothetical protein
MEHFRKIPGIRNTVFSIVWLCSLLYLLWQVWTRQQSDNYIKQWAIFAVLALLSGVLIYSIPNPILKQQAVNSVKTTHGYFILLFVVIGLFASVLSLNANILWLIPFASLVILIILHKPLKLPEVKYALFLAVVSSVSALWAGWITEFRPIVWAVLQLLIVTTSCLAGWKLMEYLFLSQYGIGLSSMLKKGPSIAAQNFIRGVILSVPWGIAIVLLNVHIGEVWVKAWWHPLAAIQPAISEELWGRVFLVPVIYWFTSRIFHPHKAFNVAMLIGVYWFAFLHTYSSPGVIVNTLFTGTLFALPVSYITLYKDLESGIGFHFGIDLCKFIGAYIFFRI